MKVGALAKPSIALPVFLRHYRTRMRAASPE
jgi:hypothetical protein